MDQVNTDIEQFLASEEHTSDTTWDWEKTWNFGKTILRQLLVHPVQDNRPPEKSDFLGYVRLTEGRLNSFLRFLALVKHQLKRSSNITIYPEFTSLLIILCAEHSCDKEWTSTLTVQASSELLSMWLDAVEQNSISELLCYNNCLKLILQHLLAKLDKSDWKKNPSAATAFAWIVLHAGYRCFVDGEHRMMIAISLRLIDDFEAENSLMGVKCIKHIISNMTRADFRHYGLVIYDALKTLLYVREPKLIACLIPCLVDVLKKMGTDDDCGTVGRYKIPMVWSGYECVFSIVLTAVEMEGRCDVIVAYLQAMPTLLGERATLAHRFSRRILDLAEKYLSLNDAQHKLVNRMTVEMIKKFVSCVRDHVRPYAPRLRFMLKRTQLDLETADERDDAGLIDVARFLEDIDVIVEDTRIQYELSKKSNDGCNNNIVVC